MQGNGFQQLSFQAGTVFTPGAPINEKDLFMGRVEQIDAILKAVSQRGYHAVLYGERGVGKTSLSNVLGDFVQENATAFLVPRVNCDGSDTYASIWCKALKDIEISKTKRTIGFGNREETETQSIIDTLPNEVTPDDVRRVLRELSRGVILIIVFDEFDRLADKTIASLMADTIKSLSDYAIDATVLLIGVADSVDELIEEHHSIERALIQVPMPRMARPEIQKIFEAGFSKLGMTVNPDALDELVSLSQGLPYIAHLLGLHTSRAALSDLRKAVAMEDVDAGVHEAVEQWQQSIKTAYYNAVTSPQPGNIFKEVLLACALAEVDDLGYFTAAAVRQPLRVITGKQYDIPNFARHLKEFSEENRGDIIQRVGERRRLRYRFKSPIMRPYIVMRGFSDSLLTRAKMRRITGG